MVELEKIIKGGIQSRKHFQTSAMAMGGGEVRGKLLQMAYNGLYGGKGKIVLTKNIHCEARSLKEIVCIFANRWLVISYINH